MNKLREMGKTGEKQFITETNESRDRCRGDFNYNVVIFVHILYFNQSLHNSNINLLAWCLLNE